MSMRIAIVTTQVPFIYGGAEVHAEELKSNLERHGHCVELVKIPFKWYPPQKISEHILTARLVDLVESCGEKIDLLLGLKFPAYYIPHPNKILWILHQHRTAYDLWGTKFGDLHGTEGTKVRNIIITSDNAYLKEAKRIFTNSHNVSSRLKKYNNINSVPLYHPPKDHDKLVCGSFGDYIFYPSLINSIKRQCLAVEAMKYTRTNVRLWLAGACGDSSYEKSIYGLIEKYRLENKVKIMGRVSQEEKIRLYAESLGILFIPYDEDYGYVTLEAFYSKKLVITTLDSGGPLEFVKNNENGFVVQPEPRAIAETMDLLYKEREKARKMGLKGYETIMDMNISWDKVIETLLDSKSAVYKDCRL